MENVTEKPTLHKLRVEFSKAGLNLMRMLASKEQSVMRIKNQIFAVRNILDKIEERVSEEKDVQA